jgi:hypothetical protein
MERGVCGEFLRWIRGCGGEGDLEYRLSPSRVVV